MSGAPQYYPREGIVTFLSYLVLLPICVLFFVTLLGGFLGAGFGAGFSQLLQRIPGYLGVAIENFDISLMVPIALFALYFGARAIFTRWFGRLEAALVAAVLPYISLSAVGLYHSSGQNVGDNVMNELTVDRDHAIAIILPVLISVLVCRYILIRLHILHRPGASP